MLTTLSISGLGDRLSANNYLLVTCSSFLGNHIEIVALRDWVVFPNTV